MRRIVVIFGLLAGAVLSVMMLVSAVFKDQIGFDRGVMIGYTTMVAAFLMIWFGIRSYRDNVLAGTIRFGRAFLVGLYITVVASVCYVATWQFVYYRISPDFMEQYSAHALEKARAGGATAQELEVKARDLAKFSERYRHPLFNVGITFLEPLPVGLFIALVSAGFLSRRRTVGNSQVPPT